MKSFLSSTAKIGAVVLFVPVPVPLPLPDS